MEQRSKLVANHLGSRHLRALLNAGWVEVGDDYYYRFKDAMTLQSRVKRIGTPYYQQHRTMTPSAQVRPGLVEPAIRDLVEELVGRAVPEALREQLRSVVEDHLQTAVREHLGRIKALRMTVGEDGIEIEDLQTRLQGTSPGETATLTYALGWARDLAEAYIEELLEERPLNS